jgi:immunity protein 8 of polymorphic toxin system
MRAVVRYFHSPDVSDLRTYLPPDPTNFSFPLQVTVGPSDGPGEESFGVEVCTPQALAERLRSSGGPLLGRHFLFVDGYDWDGISSFIRGWVARFEEETWDEVAEKLGRLGHWEFEDYRG